MTTPYTLDLRSLARDLIGFAMYVVSWNLLTLVPLLIATEVLSEPGIFSVSLLDGISSTEAVVLGINLTEVMLGGLLIRWLARGVIQGNKMKTIFVSLCAFAVGTLYLYVQVAPLGVFFLTVGLVLCIVMNPTAKRDRT